jgi:hypothetical protein
VAAPASLASVAVALGYKCLLVSSDALSAEKLAHMHRESLANGLAILGRISLIMPTS